MDAPDGTAPLLLGSPLDRGRGQAALARGREEAVRLAIAARLGSASAILARPMVRAWLEGQRRFCDENCGPEMAETAGISEAFSIRLDDLFTYLHLGIVADLGIQDGCSAWARRLPRDGAMVVKNRDFRGEHRGLQTVTLHRDPECPDNAVLAVGSLGSPGAYSSGINAQGLAVVDTAIGARSHEIGWLRYFLMTRMLWRCRSLDEALDFVSSVRHAAGGSLVVADAHGAAAAIELLPRGPAIQRATTVLRTNHFLTAPEEGLSGQRRLSDPMARSSTGRLARLARALAAMSGHVELEKAATLMALHATETEEALCRHGEDGDALTLSTSLYLTAPPMLYFGDGNPCRATWTRYAFETRTRGVASA